MIEYYSAPKNTFSDLYLAVRTAENRLLSDQQVLRLPDTDPAGPNASQWSFRKKSAIRFAKYVAQKHKPLKILDIGCGNGWFSNKLGQIDGVEVLGIDINITELKQAARLFGKNNLRFAYADIFSDIADEKFDIAVFNSCFQYFENVRQTLDAAQKWLKSMGEIHLIDSPFYRPDQIENAKARTTRYYQNLGFPEMASHYFHHSWSELPNLKTHYKPSLFAKLLKTDSPFCWISIDAETAKV